MKKLLAFLFFLTGTAMSASADERMIDDQLPVQTVSDTELSQKASDMELTLDVPEMEPKLVEVETPDYHPELSLRLTPVTLAAPVKTSVFKNPKSRWAWHEERPEVKPYTFMQDMTWVGVPIFVAGIIAKGEKKSFRQDYSNIHANTRLLTNFKSSIDDYSQYFGPAMSIGLKLGGVEGRSDWGRFLTSSLLGYASMAAIVNGIKYTAKEMRPDGSQANSWPSGHTATSFVGATILHKEYGLTHSPWFSVAGYGIATATGIMRVLNNRHWVSDVLSGAGIGIVSGELGYAIGDLIFKGKGLRRGDLDNLTDINHPSFFSVSMGIGLNNPTLSFEIVDPDNGKTEQINMDFQMSTAVGVEGAYFMNRYVGIGGRLRVKSTPVKGWNNLLSRAETSLKETMEDLQFIDEALEHGTVMQNLVTTPQFTIESDHLTEFAADLGFYFNIPLGSRFAIGTKLLIGRSIMQELDLDAQFSGHVIDMPYNATIVNGDITDFEIVDFTDTGKQYDYQWDLATLGGSNSTKYGTGLSLTYAYKHNFRWTVFADYDYTKKDFTATVDESSYLNEALPNIVSLMSLGGEPMVPEKQTITKKLNQWTIGASFTVAF